MAGLISPDEHLDALAAHVDISETPGDGPMLARVDALLNAIDATGNADDDERYGTSFATVFAALDALDARLAGSRFLLGGTKPTRSDWWLYVLLVRFDVVYYALYKLNRTRVADFAHLGPYLRDLHQLGQLDDLLDFDAIKQHHYLRIGTVVPRGAPDLWLPHDRMARFAKQAQQASATEEDASRRRPEGEWVRKVSGHRDWITRDGSSGFPPEADRYHLYIANNCPWCHRVALTRSLKRLHDVVSMDVLFYRRDPERGWQFRPDEPGCTTDSLYGSSFLRDVYDKVGSKETSAPVLFDKKTETIVSNESADIIRMLDQAFVSDAPTLYPSSLATAIDQLNAWIYTDINNGAYKAGFTKSQAAYDKAYDRLFAALDRVDSIVADKRFLTGPSLTEADVRLFPTIFRFDHIYYTRFKLNRRMIRDYRHLHRWLRDVYHQPGVADASNLDHARRGYFGRTGNNIVPLGPNFDFEPAPTARELARLD